jgi:hypothetical protein
MENSGGEMVLEVDRRGDIHSGGQRARLRFALLDAALSQVLLTHSTAAVQIIKMWKSLL